ncbi:sugar phosphate isomerase/epimerase family protein [Ferruginibacter sp.]
MQNRKQFLQTAATLSLGSIALSNKTFAALLRGKKYPPAGLQLFTFFNEIDADVPGTLKKIATVGYKEIESAFSKKGGYYGMKPKEFAAMLKDMGMSWKSHHVLGAQFKLPPGAKMPVDADGKPIIIPPMRNLKENMQQLVDEAAEGGVEFLVCASTPITTLEDVKASIEVLNKTDEACKKAGIGFAYHNHDAEFRSVEGQIPYELFLAQTTMKMELDLAWATKGGKDPVELFKQHPKRFPLWHVKDLDAKHETVLPVGEGTIDYKRIFDAASTAGMKHFFIEHDMPKNPLTSITSSFNYLNKMLYKK